MYIRILILIILLASCNKKEIDNKTDSIEEIDNKTDSIEEIDNKTDLKTFNFFNNETVIKETVIKECNNLFLNNLSIDANMESILLVLKSDNYLSENDIKIIKKEKYINFKKTNSFLGKKIIFNESNIEFNSLNNLLSSNECILDISRPFFFNNDNSCILIVHKFCGISCGEEYVYLFNKMIDNWYLKYKFIHTRA